MGVRFWQNSTHSIHSKVWTFKLRAAPRWPLRDHQLVQVGKKSRVSCIFHDAQDVLSSLQSQFMAVAPGEVVYL